ncbi:MAG: redoxin domain-containing protein [Anaerolineae bacterium]|nr:redoxin domain-containing protein [Anaerolineae bacterium]
MENVTLGLAFMAGLLSFISPCCLPLVPAYISYMGGRLSQTAALRADGTKVKVEPGTWQRVHMLLHGLAFVGGFTLVFVLLGIMTTAFVSVLGSTVVILTDIIGRIGGVLIILFGLHFMGVLRALFRTLRRRPGLLNPLTSVLAALGGSLFLLWGFIELPLALPFLAAYLLALLLGGAFAQPRLFWLALIGRLETAIYSDTRGSLDSGRRGLGGSFMMGIIFSAGWSPCIGPMLGTILTLAANTGDASAAVPLLTAYSLGLGIPFLLAALLMDGAQHALRRVQRHLHAVERFSGALLVVIGVLVASGQLALISQNLSTQFADFSSRVEECGMGFFQGELQFGQVSPCLEGRLVSVALNQGASATLSDTLPEMQFVFDLAAADTVEVQLTRLEDPAALTVRLLDAGGALLAERSGADRRDDKTFISVAGVALPPGSYTLRVERRQAGPVSFRLKVVSTGAAPVTARPSAPDNSQSPVAALAAQGLQSITAAGTASPPLIGTAVGQVAPPFTLTTDLGASFDLWQLRGRVVLLNFWGTWCGPCRREMPEFQALYAEYGGDDFEIVAVAVRDTVAAVQAFREEFGLTFTLPIDEETRVNDLYHLPGQPVTFLLDADGVILYSSYSVVTREQMEPLLRQALGR